jgi:hypothetical protein
MNTIAIIAIVLAVAIVILLVYASTRPDTFRVQRTASINAPADRIFPLINEFDNWTAWSPYEHRDPNLKRTRSGPQSGKGAIYEWDGNKNVGQGRMEVLDSAPPSKVLIKLDFFRPFRATNTAEFTLQPRGGATDVTWAMYGPVPYFAKIMHMFCNVDRMCGRDFEAGLASMKARLEA